MDIGVRLEGSKIIIENTKSKEAYELQTVGGKLDPTRQALIRTALEKKIHEEMTPGQQQAFFQQLKEGISILTVYQQPSGNSAISYGKMEDSILSERASTTTRQFEEVLGKATWIGSERPISKKAAHHMGIGLSPPLNLLVKPLQTFTKQESTQSPPVKQEVAEEELPPVVIRTRQEEPMQSLKPDQVVKKLDKGWKEEQAKIRNELQEVRWKLGVFEEFFPTKQVASENSTQHVASGNRKKSKKPAPPTTPHPGREKVKKEIVAQLMAGGLRQDNVKEMREQLRGIEHDLQAKLDESRGPIVEPEGLVRKKIISRFKELEETIDLLHDPDSDDVQQRFNKDNIWAKAYNDALTLPLESRINFFKELEEHGGSDKQVIQKEIGRLENELETVKKLIAADPVTLAIARYESLQSRLEAIERDIHGTTVVKQDLEFRGEEELTAEEADELDTLRKELPQLRRDLATTRQQLDIVLMEVHAGLLMKETTRCLASSDSTLRPRYSLALNEHIAWREKIQQAQIKQAQDKSK